MAASRRRKWSIAVACVATAIVVVALFLPTLARPFVRAKLQAMLAGQLDATLTFGAIDYLPPYGVRVRDARLAAIDPAGKPFDLVTARMIELKLARFPLLPGPLLIERLDVIAPTLHLIQTAAGTAGQTLARGDEPAAPSSTTQQKLSECFELRKVTVADAQLTFDDRTIANAVPLVWRNLRLDMNTSPASAANYRFDVRAGDGAAATLVANGSLDIDRLRLHVDACDVTVNVDPAATATASAVPGAVQAILRAERVAGTLAIHVAGDLPLADPRESKLVATLALRDAAGRLPGAAEPLDALAADVTCWADPAALRVRIDRLVARRGDASAELTLPSATLDVASGNVEVKDLTLRVTPGTDRRALPAALARALSTTRIDGALTAVVNAAGNTGGDWRAWRATCEVTPHDVRIATPLLREAVHDLAPLTLDVRDGVASLKNLRAAYGNDVFFLRAARVPLATLPEAIRAEQLAGCVTFDARRATYPPAIEAQLLNAEPRGPFFFDGDATIDRASVPAAVNYRVRVTSERASLSPMRRRVPMFNVVSDLLVTPTLVTIDRFEASALAGQVMLTGSVRPGETTSYAGALRLRRIDLNGLAALANVPGEPPLTIAGELDADVNFVGAGTDASAIGALRAEGAARVERGDLFHVPTLEAITNRMGLRSAATLGEASASFTLERGLLRLKDAAIGSPAVGVRGNGTINVIDHRLDLQVIATPLDDWEKSLRGDGNGSVSNVAANVAGSVQHAMNKVTEDYLYHVHVAGTTAAPDVQVITAPALRDAPK